MASDRENQKSAKKPASLGLVVIDPVRDFVTSDGPFVRKYGEEACCPLQQLVRKTLPELIATALQAGSRVDWILLVRSEYRRSQFASGAGGDVDVDPLMDLCTTDEGRGFADEIRDVIRNRGYFLMDHWSKHRASGEKPFLLLLTKCSNDIFNCSDSQKSALRALLTDTATEEVLVTGLTLTSCVQESVKAMARQIILDPHSSATRIIVARDGVASRAGHGQDERAEQIFEELQKDFGVEIVDTWKSVVDVEGRCSSNNNNKSLITREAAGGHQTETASNLLPEVARLKKYAEQVVATRLAGAPPRVVGDNFAVEPPSEERMKKRRSGFLHSDGGGPKDFPPAAPPVVGIYGVSGSGKSYILDHLRATYGKNLFLFIDGKERIACAVERLGYNDASGMNQSSRNYHVSPELRPLNEPLDEQKEDRLLKLFATLSPADKILVRESAISDIAASARASQKIAVVAGHYAFPTLLSSSDGDEPTSSSFETAFTNADSEVYTHIFYLRTPASEILKRCTKDAETGKRVRKVLLKEKTEMVDAWMAFEEAGLAQKMSSAHSKFILKLAADDYASYDRVVAEWLLTIHESFNNQQVVPAVLDFGLKNLRPVKNPTIETYLVFDADRTLAPMDTGALFFELLESELQKRGREDMQLQGRFCSRSSTANITRLETIFTASYKYTEFVSAAKLYADVLEVLGPTKFRNLCSQVAHKVSQSLYPEFRDLIKQIVASRDIGNANKLQIVIVTCGLRVVWEQAASAAVCPGSFPLCPFVVVLGLDPERNTPVIINPAAKLKVVEHLRQRSPGCRILAFGDSPLDIPMLRGADYGYALVGTSKSFAAELKRSSCGHQQLLDEMSARFRVRKLDLLSTSSKMKTATNAVALSLFLPEATMDEVRDLVFHCGIENRGPAPSPPSTVKNGPTVLVPGDQESPSRVFRASSTGPRATAANKDSLGEKFVEPAMQRSRTGIISAKTCASSSKALWSKTVRNCSTSGRGPPAMTSQDFDFFALCFDGSTLPSSQILATKMRDAANAGPALGAIHTEVGKYLALKMLDCFGDEFLGMCDIKHVQGHLCPGGGFEPDFSFGQNSRMLKKASILAIMRAGKYMADGVYDILGKMSAARIDFPHQAGDLLPDKHNVISGAGVFLLVDPVVNSGATMVEFIKTIAAEKAKEVIVEVERNKNKNKSSTFPDNFNSTNQQNENTRTRNEIRILMLTGVVQAATLNENSEFRKQIKQIQEENARSTSAWLVVKVYLFTLRVSENQYNGVGGTDTGNRLFNTEV